nr:hypothetical protein [uncultured Capnocytophaga sp.]
MKRILLIIITGFSFVTTGCSTKEENKESIDCCSPPVDFYLFVDKKSSLRQDFLNYKGEFDKENVYFYQLLDKNTEKKYDTNFYFGVSSPKKDGYDVLSVYPTPFLHTGKTEILYLKNKTKSYKIEYVGTQGKCCTLQFKEMHIDGIKNNDFILK